jgi:hypothetical protein
MQQSILLNTTNKELLNSSDYVFCSPTIRTVITALLGAIRN